jgi:TATA-box binding protein (TBP) (component of TFIID and TFIIIB)
MNLAAWPGWGGLGPVDSEDPEISEYDVRAGIPTEMMWEFLHGKNPRAMDHVRKNVREYVKRVRTRQIVYWAMKMKSNAVSEKVAMEKRSYMYGENRQLVGCTVNVSALGSSPPNVFDMKKILHTKKKGKFEVNRQRNAAVQCSIRSTAPTRKMSESLVARIMRPTMQQIEEISERSLDTIGDRTSRDTAVAYSPNSSGRSQIEESPESSKKKAVPAGRRRGGNKATKRGRRNGSDKGNMDLDESITESASIIDLVRCTGKPKDHTYLVYPSASYVLTGANDPVMALCSMWTLIWQFACEGMPCSHLETFSIQNDVFTFRIPFSVNLLKLKKSWGAVVSYDPRAFPAAIFRPPRSLIAQAVERAQHIKRMRHDIVCDDSWMSEKEREAKNFVKRIVQSRGFEMQQKRLHEGILRCETKSNASSSVIWNKVGITGSKAKKNSLVVLIHSTGAIVITGTPDLDVAMGLFELLYDLLLLFHITEKSIGHIPHALLKNRTSSLSGSRALTESSSSARGSHALTQMFGVRAGGDLMNEFSTTSIVNQLLSEPTSGNYDSRGHRRNLIKLGVDDEETILKKQRTAMAQSHAGLIGNTTTAPAIQKMLMDHSTNNTSDSFSRMIQCLVVDDDPRQSTKGNLLKTNVEPET